MGSPGTPHHGDFEYVVLVGDVGSGKSTVGEKLTGVEGRSSASSTSFTTEMAVFQTRDGGLVVADTPGSNAMRDKLSHNTEIASALNYADVSRILLVVKAETRIGQFLSGWHCEHLFHITAAH